MSGDTLRREILGECQVHCLGVIVEENLDDRDPDRAAIVTRQVEKDGVFRAGLRIETAERHLAERRHQDAEAGALEQAFRDE
jgi:hypothetical protein